MEYQSIVKGKIYSVLISHVHSRAHSDTRLRTLGADAEAPLLNSDAQRASRRETSLPAAGCHKSVSGSVQYNLRLLTVTPLRRGDAGRERALVPSRAFSPHSRAIVSVRLPTHAAAHFAVSRNIRRPNVVIGCTARAENCRSCAPVETSLPFSPRLRLPHIL